VKAFVTALFSGGASGDPTQFVTPGLGHHLPPVPKTTAGQPVPLSDVSYIASSDTSSRRIVRYGATVTRMSHFKALYDGDPVYLTFYFTSDGQIADYSGY
jgi:hypothetical protein